eukprot:2146581-Rhodomonas_salina.1
MGCVVMLTVSVSAGNLVFISGQLPMKNGEIQFKVARLLHSVSAIFIFELTEDFGAGAVRRRVHDGAGLQGRGALCNQLDRAGALRVFEMCARCRVQPPFLLPFCTAAEIRDTSHVNITFLACDPVTTPGARSLRR